MAGSGAGWSGPGFIWKPDPLDENPIIVYTLIYSVYTEIYENFTSHTRISLYILVWKPDPLRLDENPVIIYTLIY